MAQDYKVPLTLTVTNTASTAGVDAAVKSAVEGLIVLPTTVPNSISIGALFTYTAASIFTYAYNITYQKVETL